MNLWQSLLSLVTAWKAQVEAGVTGGQVAGYTYTTLGLKDLIERAQLIPDVKVLKDASWFSKQVPLATKYLYTCRASDHSDLIVSGQLEEWRSSKTEFERHFLLQGLSHRCVLLLNKEQHESVERMQVACGLRPLAAAPFDAS